MITVWNRKKGKQILLKKPSAEKSSPQMNRYQKESPLKCDEIKKGRPARIRSLFPEIVKMNRLSMLKETKFQVDYSY